MRMYDLIVKKRDGESLSAEEIRYLLMEYVAGNIPDYQMSAFLMAVYFKGMDDEELSSFTLEMAHSGQMVDLSSIKGIKVDKHSTGGVGDKTTFIVGPVVAALGGKVAKMSGRGLGHTGGTVDKMEAIPGIKSSLSQEDFARIVNSIGISVIGQSGDLAPADKRLYALRDVTGTVESIPLIASSIMSKKLASGSDAIVLDVKTGSGAFMKTIEDSIKLAEKMVAIGTHQGKRMVALITDMDRPLGKAIGNSLEIMEVIQTLKGNGPEDLVRECIEIAGNMLYVSEKGTLDDCRRMAKEAIADGRGLAVFRQMIAAQGGDSRVIEDYSLFPLGVFTKDIISVQDGYITHMNAEQCGIASVCLGAGRERKEDAVDYGAGIMMLKKTGDFVRHGEILATLFTSDEGRLAKAAKMYMEGLVFGSEPPNEKPTVFARVTAGETARYI